jgi:hypothetical protein
MNDHLNAETLGEGYARVALYAANGHSGIPHSTFVASLHVRPPHQVNINQSITRRQAMPKTKTFDVEAARAKYAETLTHIHLVHGEGKLEEGTACTESALQLALSGKLTADLHPCVAPELHRWVIRTQDALPIEFLNSPEWKETAVGIVGTAGKTGLLEIMMTAMWEAMSVLTFADADAQAAWSTMLEERTAKACRLAARAVDGHVSLTRFDHPTWALKTLRLLVA